MPFNPIEAVLDRRWLESLLPDFVLAFAFFTSLIYAVVGQRFGHQRSAVAISATIGMALSIVASGMTRQRHDLTLRTGKRK